MNGLKFAASGFVGRAPTMSGNSCGGFVLSIVDICKSLREWARGLRHCNPAIYWAQFSKSQILDPVSNFTLVVSRLLPAALDRYPRGFNRPCRGSQPHHSPLSQEPLQRY
jgi:hypothetical protein